MWRGGVTGGARAEPPAGPPSVVLSGGLHTAAVKTMGWDGVERGGWGRHRHCSLHLPESQVGGVP